MNNKILPGNTVGSFSSTQHAVLVGSLLGDGTLRKQGTRTNALFEVNHSYKSKTYVDWKYKIFQQYILTPPKRRRGNGKRVAYRFTTRSLPLFTHYHERFYSGRTKKVPRDIVLNALMLAVWFMDDGSKSRSASYLNTQQFSQEDQFFLLDLLKRTFGIKGLLNRDKKYFRIRITSKGTKQLKKIIEPFVHPVMRYKLT